MLLYLCSLIEDESDRQQFTSIYHTHHSLMEQVALHILGQTNDAEDAVQNAFIQVIKHFEKIHQIPCEELRFWLISIVKNEAFMLLRKRHPTLPLEDWDGFTHAAKDINDYQGIVTLLQSLPPTYRGVLEMKLLLGYSDREIGQHLGISETAVSSRANRGRALFREILSKEGYTP